MSILKYQSDAYETSEEGYANPSILKDAAFRMLDIIRNKFPTESICLVGTGGSGSAVATAILLEAYNRNVTNVTMVIGGRSFQSALKNRSRRGECDKIVFVDDHVCIGETLKRVSEKLKPDRKIDLVLTITTTTPMCEDQEVIALRE